MSGATIHKGKPLRIIIAGGGTGGHIFPAVAIANAIKEIRPDTEFLFVGAKGKMEMEKIPQAGYTIKGLDIAGFNRSSLLKNIGLPWKMLKSFLQVRQIFKSFHPDAVIGVGGYSTFPVLRTAQAKGIPSFIHESNSFAGKANMMLGKKATRIYVAGEGMEKFFPADKILISGNPVRKAIMEKAVRREEALQFFGLSALHQTILVMGGSLGARSINRAVAAGVQRLKDHQLQLLWQTGKDPSGEFRRLADPEAGIVVKEFISEMEMAYAAADVVVSRAGAMAVTEICITGKPAVFVPYPLAAEDHQTSNALHLVNRNAALMVKDADAGQSLLDVLLGLCEDRSKQEAMRKQLADIAIHDADTLIAKDILNHIS
jgi:UDP-N-acetylglucosamine--N-acetylmuramyl-(pentapeptide) pyrophosphoryl-undecaprenol N-acetylglucosamine transferase